MITHREPDILECGVKWALRSITMNKPSGGDGISVEIFQILKDDAVKMLHLICQQIWKTQEWPRGWKRSVFIPSPNKGNAKECSNYCTVTSKVMLKILQSGFNNTWTIQQYMRLQQSGFNNTWTINAKMFKLVLEKAEEPEIKLPISDGSSKKAREFQKNIYFCLLTMPKPLTV